MSSISPRLQLDLSTVSSASDEDAKTPTSTQTSGQVGVLTFKLIDLLAKPGMLQILYSQVGKDWAQPLATFRPKTFFAEHFPYLLVRVCRYYGVIHLLLKSTVAESLEGLGEPQLMFRTDHCATRLLREISAQLFGNQLVPKFARVLRKLGSRKLSEVDVAKAASKILDTLFNFTVPCEFKSVCEIVCGLIEEKFPGASRVGLASIIFLRYLCPLFLGSPQLFGASGDFYQQNCLRLVKLLQAAANGVTPSDLSEKTAKIFFTDGNAGRMTSFFSRLAYKPIQSKGSDIVLSDEIPSAEEVVEFFQIIAVYAPDVESALANLAAAGLVAPKLLERWRELLVQWSSLARVLDSQTPRARDRSIFPDVPKYAELEPLSAHNQITTKPPRKKGSRLMMNLKPLLPQFATSTIRRSHSAQAQPVEHLGMPAKDDFRKSLSCDIFSPDDVVASASRSLESGLNAQYAITPAIANRSTRLRSAHIPSQPPTIIQGIFPSQDDVRAWDTTEIQFWLEANGLGQLTEAFDSITGEQLLLGQFVLPTSLSPALRSDFFASLNQLKALSLNYFDASAFPDPASQIEALKAAIVKISDVLEMSS